MKKKLYDLYDLYPQYGPVESTSLVKACSLMCRLYVKKKIILGILVKNISVNVSNKSRGSEMHWVGGRIKSSKGQYLPFYVRIIGVNVVVFYFFLLLLR